MIVGNMYDNKLLNYFANKYVQIVTDMIMTIENDEGEQVTTPLVLEGYILDCDNEFIFIGPSSTIVHAVKKATVLQINKVPKKNVSIN